MAFRTQRRVEFRDTDAAGIVHFSAFFPMMEAAEHEMLRSVGISVMPQGDPADAVTWPRVAANCQYRSAARFEEVLQIDVTIDRLGDSSVTYGMRFEREGQLIAEGQITAVCCRLHRDGSGGGLEKVAIPPAIRELLQGI
ncbi:MAG: thioesterase family protein [Planctomycetota bacterium]